MSARDCKSHYVAIVLLVSTVCALLAGVVAMVCGEEPWPSIRWGVAVFAGAFAVAAQMAKFLGWFGSQEAN
jgi:hypothetical protein